MWPSLLFIICCYLLGTFTRLISGFKIHDFHPSLSSSSSSECLPQQCINAVANPTWEQIVSCRDSSAVDCEYYGTFLFNGDSASDLQFQPWNHGAIVTGTLPIKTNSELNGFYTSVSAKLKLHLQVIDLADNGRRTPLVRRCTYMLLPIAVTTAATTNSSSATTTSNSTNLTAVFPPAALLPTQNCDHEGIPLQYRVNSFLEVGYRLTNRTVTSRIVLPLRTTLYSVTNTFGYLIEPMTDVYVTKATVYGSLDFRMISYAAIQARGGGGWWSSSSSSSETGQDHILASATGSDGTVVECLLSPPSSASSGGSLASSSSSSSSVEELARATEEYDELESDCLNSLREHGDFYQGSYSYNEIIERPTSQCSTLSLNQIWAALPSLNLIGSFVTMNATEIQILMKTAAFEDCEVYLLQATRTTTARGEEDEEDDNDGSSSSFNVSALCDGTRHRQPSSPTGSYGLLSSGTRLFTLDSVSFSRSPFFGLAFSSALERCGVAIDQVRVLEAEVAYELNLSDLTLAVAAASPSMRDHDDIV